MTDSLSRPDPNFDPQRELGVPGAAPFTRGVHPRMYADRLWTMRQYSGYADAGESNRRYRALLQKGQTGISVAFDLPTQMGYDPDHPRSSGEVGKSGVSIAVLEDIQTLFSDIPLDRVTVSMTINATAMILLALHTVAAQERGIDPSTLGGTVQNDILKEFIARGCYIYPPRPSLKIAVDTIEYSVRNLPQWNFISVSGYHIREAGSTAAQELGFTLANGLCYFDEARKRGIDPHEVGKRMSFFFNAHNNFLEEIAKFRAARRLWSRLLKERFGITDPRALACRFHVQTAGSSLTAQQPHNNVVRVTLQALGAIIGGAQSLHTNSMDEALALPTEAAATLALRSQQILAHEIGIQDVVDPFGGSYHLERETDRLEEEARTYIGEIDRRGGAVEAIEQRYYQMEIEKSAIAYQREIENGNRGIVGVNKYVEEELGGKIEVLKVDEKVRSERGAFLAGIRSRRSGSAHQKALDGLKRSATEGTNLFPSTLECVRARVTLGEICAALREVYGTYDKE